MNKCVARGLSVVTVCLGLAAYAPRIASPSDHADPMSLKDPESNITGLFFFPRDERIILILNIRRSLASPGPYDLAPFEYAVHIDLHSRVTRDDLPELARYGGTVASPEGIKADVTIRFRLNDDASVRSQSFEGLAHHDQIRVFTGVRDDPFIFPRFFKKNVISMVMSIPMAAFPAGQRDWILWGTTTRDGVQVDHVGRSNRTQLARFDFLNTLPPSEHVAAIKAKMASQQGLYQFLGKYRETAPLAGLLQYVLNIRKYDLVPDVMLYGAHLPPGFPNGRRLEDDVAAITCLAGDCVLQELSHIEGDWPRSTVNDKPFLAEFPYLAEPWLDATPVPTPASIWPLVAGIGAVVVAVLLGLWYLRRWYRSRLTGG